MGNENKETKKNKESYLLVDKVMIILFALVITSIFALGISAGAFMQDKYTDKLNKEEIKTIPNTKQDIINDCKGLPLDKAAECIALNVKSFEKYVVTEDTLNLTFEELKQKGGDCFDYSKLIQEIGLELGYYSEIVTPTTIRNEAIWNKHAFVVISNAEFYCTIDITETACRRLE